MRAVFLAAVLVVVSSFSSSSSTTSSSSSFYLFQGADAAILGDARRKHKPSPEDAPHTAYLITTSRINYPDRERAEDDLAAIKAGRLSFIEAMRKQSDFNQRNSRNKEAQYSGDLGLLSYDQLDEPHSKVLFDIRIPVSDTADRIIGPLCDEVYGCSLYIVFQRFRRSFFSQAWLDADEFCMNNDLDFGQLLQSLGGDNTKIMAGRIWPDDIAAFQKIKIEQVRNDLKRMKDGDPSTEPPRARRSSAVNPNLDLVKAQMAERRRFHEYFVTKDMKRIHPEVTTMSIGEIVRSGWVDTNKVRRMGFGKYLTEESEKAASTRETDVNAARAKEEAEAAEARQKAAKEAPGTRRVYGTGGMMRDLSAEGAPAPSPVDGSIADPPKQQQQQQGEEGGEKQQCGGIVNAEGQKECPLDVEKIQRAAAEASANRAAAEKAKAAEVAAEQNSLDDLDEF